MVAAWQSIVTKFILCRKMATSDGYNPHIARRWHHDKRLGLSVPLIASQLRAQRLRHLQMLMRDATTEPQLWQALVLRQYALTMGQLYRASHPWDFLFYKPNKLTFWLNLPHLHSLWEDVWLTWSSTPMSKRLEIPPNYATTMQMPVWLTEYEPLRSNAATTMQIGHGSEEREWCLSAAEQGHCSISAMLLADGSWPASREVFVNTLSHANAGVQVWLGPHGRIEVVICRHIGAMYCHLSRVYWQIQDAFADASNADRQAPAVTQPFVGLVKDQIQPF